MTTILIAINGTRATVLIECNRFRICIFGDIIDGCGIAVDCGPYPPPYGIFAWFNDADDINEFRSKPTVYKWIELIDKKKSTK